MYEIKAKICDVSFMHHENTAQIVLKTDTTNDIAELYDIYHDIDLTVKISRYRRKRSLDANNYAWLLLGRLAAKLGMSKTEIYKECIREVGGNCETVCVKDEAVKKLCNGWEHNGIGWVTDKMPSKIKGCTNVILYYGSSMYNSAQMSCLIDIIIAECKENDIQTMTPDEILKLKEFWSD